MPHTCGLWSCSLSTKDMTSSLISGGDLAYDTVSQRKPDLIIIDTWLESRESGWTLLQTLLLDRETARLPILICSSDNSEFERRAQNLDGFVAIDSLAKPFKPEEL